MGLNFVRYTYNILYNVIQNMKYKISYNKENKVKHFRKGLRREVQHSQNKSERIDYILARTSDTQPQFCYLPYEKP